MTVKIERPTVVQAAGTKPKLIEEFFGLVNSRTPQISIARMQSPSGWIEPSQTPEFDEYTIVLRGLLRVETATAVYDVHARRMGSVQHSGIGRRRIPCRVPPGILSCDRASGFLTILTMAHVCHRVRRFSEIII
jgi:hypothetical protein